MNGYKTLSAINSTANLSQVNLNCANHRQRTNPKKTPTKLHEFDTGRKIPIKLEDFQTKIRISTFKNRAMRNKEKR